MVQSYENTPQTNNAFNSIFDYYLSQMHTITLGFIEEYDAKKQTASVKPVFVESYLQDDSTILKVESPVLLDVPVFFPRGGGAVFSYPVSQGDRCLLLIVERTIDNYVESDGKTLQNVTDMRTHDLSDAVAFVGLGTNKTALKTKDIDKNIVLGFDEGAQVQVTPDGKVLIGDISADSSAANKALALAEKVNSELSTFASIFNAHVHISAAAGAPNAPTLTTITPGTVDSEKVFTNG